MNQTSEDRRVRRTRRRLKEALLELLQERSYESITVQEIIDRADVGRSTFYSHFPSKESLLLDGFDRGLAFFHGSPEGASDPKGAPRPFSFSVPLLTHLSSQRRFFLATFFGTSNPNVRRQVTGALAHRIGAELASSRKGIIGKTQEEEARRLDARAHCIAAAFIGLAGWWLTEAPHLEAAEIDRIFRDTVRD
ncbi:MAG: helix-turn-helix transcriptional regulator [Gemmatimonadetes bacterium]|nr:helix-turn-helix transcriptional regulator [Gemmatimonadota bacterium]